MERPRRQSADAPPAAEAAAVAAVAVAAAAAAAAAAAPRAPAVAMVAAAGGSPPPPDRGPAPTLVLSLPTPSPLPPHGATDAGASEAVKGVRYSARLSYAAGSSRAGVPPAPNRRRRWTGVHPTGGKGGTGAPSHGGGGAGAFVLPPCLAALPCRLASAWPPFRLYRRRRLRRHCRLRRRPPRSRRRAPPRARWHPWSPPPPRPPMAPASRLRRCPIEMPRHRGSSRAAAATPPPRRPWAQHPPTTAPRRRGHSRGRLQRRRWGRGQHARRLSTMPRPLLRHDRKLKNA